MVYDKYIEPGIYKISSVADAKWDEIAVNEHTLFLRIPD